MTRRDAEALVREVSRTAGYRGALQRLADGGPPDGPGWAVRVTALLSGSGGLVRSREAWERYLSGHARSRQREEVKRMVSLGLREPGTPMDGVLSAPTPAQVLQEPLERGAPGAPSGEPRGSGQGTSLERWRRLTEEAIAEAEREAGRLLLQADRLRDRAAQAKADARRLRRALAVVTPPESGEGDGSIRSRVLAWAGAHGGELVLSPCADELGLSVKRASDAASQLRADGRLERVGKGRYRLLGTPDGAEGPLARGTLEPQEE